MLDPSGAMAAWRPICRTCAESMVADADSDLRDALCAGVRATWGDVAPKIRADTERLQESVCVALRLE